MVSSLRLFLTVGGSGYLPTRGAVAALLAAALLFVFDRWLPSSPVPRCVLLAVLLIVCFGCALTAIRKTGSRQHYDRREIAIDEWMGAWVALGPAFISGSLTIFSAAILLALFGLFDVWKPLGIRRIDRWNAPSAVLLDDLAAGALAASLSLLALPSPQGFLYTLLALAA